MPPVNSLTIKISKSLIISSFIGEAEASSLKRKAGLRLANNPSSFLNPNNACSGLLSQSKSSHSGPPTAPKRIASDFLAISKVLSGRG